MKIGSYEIQVPFVATAAESAKDIVQFANLKAGQRAVDLGAGDGRVVVELAKSGLIVDGFEQKPDLVVRANERIMNAHLEDRASIFESDFWQVDLANYNVVYIFGMNSVMQRLEQKLEAELRPGAKFISHSFKLPHWHPKKSAKFLYMYTK